MQNTHGSFNITFVTGSPGSGKSYVCAVDVVRRLSSDKEVRIRTNLPLKPHEIAKRVAAKTGETPEQAASRIELFDVETLKKWRKGMGGPWNLADDAEGWDLLLDECHLYGPQGDRTRNEKWNEWLGEVRHEGWRRVVFITQDESKVNQAIKAHAELNYELTNSEKLRDPWCSIPLSAWYELKASFTGEYTASVTVDEYRRVKGRMKAVHRERFELTSDNFALYESHTVAGGGSVEGTVQANKREHEKRPTWLTKQKVLPVWAWFVQHQWPRLLKPVGIALAVGYLTLGGGLTDIMQWMTKIPQHAKAAGEPEIEQTAKEQADPTAPTDEEVDKELVTLPEKSKLRRWVEIARLDIARLDAKVTQQEEEIAKLNARTVRNVTLNGVYDGIAYWSTGESLKVGERLNGGPKIEAMDQRRRMVSLAGGELVRLGGVLEYRPDESFKPTPAVAGPVPEGSEPHPAKQRAGTRERSILVNRRDAAEPGGTDPGGRSPSEHRLRGDARSGEGDP